MIPSPGSSSTHFKDPSECVLRTKWGLFSVWIRKVRPLLWHVMMKVRRRRSAISHFLQGNSSAPFKLLSRAPLFHRSSHKGCLISCCSPNPKNEAQVCREEPEVFNLQLGWMCRNLDWGQWWLTASHTSLFVFLKSAFSTLHRLSQTKIQLFKYFTDFKPCFLNAFSQTIFTKSCHYW